MDKYSPILFAEAAKGTVFEITLTFKDDQEVTYLTIKLDRAFITNIELENRPSTAPGSQIVSINFSTICWEIPGEDTVCIKPFMAK
jgi:type VI protein secretion system component Hcp